MVETALRASLTMRMKNHNMPDFVGNVVERRVSDILDSAGSNIMPFSVGSEACDRVDVHHPDRQPLAASGVDVARGLQRQRAVCRMQRADMLVGQAVAVCDMRLPRAAYWVSPSRSP